MGEINVARVFTIQNLFSFFPGKYCPLGEIFRIKCYSSSLLKTGILNNGNKAPTIFLLRFFFFSEGHDLGGGSAGLKNYNRTQ